jgi:hypothetical protein
MVVKVVFLVVDADTELLGNRLAADCVEQRVILTRGSW